MRSVFAIPEHLLPHPSTGLLLSNYLLTAFDSACQTECVTFHMQLGVNGHKDRGGRNFAAHSPEPLTDIDGHIAPLLAAEAHHFRMDRSTWRDRLNKIKDAGCNTVATYVPWEVHEFEEGVFDFEGSSDSRRNLRAWIELVAQSGMALFIRPGPLVYRR